MAPATESPSSATAAGATATPSTSAAASASGFALLRRRSPLPASFRAWHVILCTLCLGFLLGMTLSSAFGVHSVAVGAQRDRSAQVTIQTVREPVARLLQQIDTVGDHARAIAQTYQTMNAMMLARRAKSSSSNSSALSRRSNVCDAPPPDTCSPYLERFLASLGSYPDALTFLRYVYITAEAPSALYSNATTSNISADNDTHASAAAESSTLIHCKQESVLFPELSREVSTTASASASSSSTTNSATTSFSTTSAAASTTSAAQDNSTTTTTTTTIATGLPLSSAPMSAKKPTLWHECGCDLIEGCYYVDALMRRHVFGAADGAERELFPARDLDGLDFVEWIKNLSSVYDARGQWNQPLEYTEIYSNASNNGSSSSIAPAVELVLQFSVPMSFDPVTGKCTSAASIDISTEFIGSVLVNDAEASTTSSGSGSGGSSGGSSSGGSVGSNATFFFVDRRGPTLLGESAARGENRIVRRKFNPLSVGASSTEKYLSPNVKRLMPLFRQWLGGSDAAVLPLNETRAQLNGYALAATPVGQHWVLLQAVGISDLSFDEYRFMRHGRLYLPVVVGASVMVALLLIEFVHGTFPSSDWKFDTQEREEQRKRDLENQRAFVRQKAAGSSTAPAGGASGSTHRAFDLLGNKQQFRHSIENED